MRMTTPYIMMRSVTDSQHIEERPVKKVRTVDQVEVDSVLGVNEASFLAGHKLADVVKRHDCEPLLKWTKCAESKEYGQGRGRRITY